MAATEYRRTPLPKHAQTPLGWVALWMAGLIFSPFVGFAIYGKVDHSGVVIGLIFAILPLTGLVAIAVLRWYTWRTLQPHIVEEWTRGRVVPAEGAPSVVLPVRFFDQKNWLELSPEGLVLSRSGLLSIQGVPDALGRLWISEQAGELFVAWKEVAEWVIDTDSDGPDYYLLNLRPRGTIKVRRFQPDTASECDLLDAVRSAGNVPVRLRCDVRCD